MDDDDNLLCKLLAHLSSLQQLVEQWRDHHTSGLAALSNVVNAEGVWSASVVVGFERLRACQTALERVLEDMGDHARQARQAFVSLSTGDARDASSIRDLLDAVVSVVEMYEREYQVKEAIVESLTLDSPPPSSPVANAYVLAWSRQPFLDLNATAVVAHRVAAAAATTRQRDAEEQRQYP